MGRLWKLRTLKVHSTRVVTHINYNYRRLKVGETPFKVRQKFSTAFEGNKANQRKYLIPDTWRKPKGRFMNCCSIRWNIIISHKGRRKVITIGITLRWPSVPRRRSMIPLRRRRQYRRHQQPFNSNTKALWETGENITLVTLISRMFRCPYLRSSIPTRSSSQKAGMTNCTKRVWNWQTVEFTHPRLTENKKWRQSLVLIRSSIKFSIIKINLR